MITCPKGAIVRVDELELIASAVREAVTSIEIQIRSDHVVNPNLRNEDDRRQEAALEKTRRQYQSLLRQLDRVKGQQA